MPNMELLRDPIWQFVGVVVAIVATAVPGVLWLMRRRRASAVSRNEDIIAELRKHLPGGVSPRATRHKKRKGDGILLANISSDFLNQFPLPVGILVAHLDRLYTPENFGASDWLTVFKRLTGEGYFEPLRERSAKLKRSIAGLEDD